eukprot:gene12115-5607_t
MSQDEEIFVMDHRLDLHFGSEPVKPTQSVKKENRIKYTIKELKSLRNSPLSRKMPSGILEIVIDNPKNQQMKYKKLIPIDEKPLQPKKTKNDEEEEKIVWDDAKTPSSEWTMGTLSSLNNREQQRKEEFEKLRREYQQKQNQQPKKESKSQENFFFGFEDALLETLEEDGSKFSGNPNTKYTDIFGSETNDFNSTSLLSMINGFGGGNSIKDMKQNPLEDRPEQTMPGSSSMPSEEAILKNLKKEKKQKKTKSKNKDMTDVQSIEAELLKSITQSSKQPQAPKKFDEKGFFQQQQIQQQPSMPFDHNMMDSNMPMFLNGPPPNWNPQMMNEQVPPPQEGFDFQLPPMFHPDPMMMPPMEGNNQGYYGAPPPEFMMMMMQQNQFQGGPQQGMNMPTEAMTVEEIEKMMMMNK